MPGKLDGLVLRMFDYAGPEMQFPMRLLFSNLWLFGWLVQGQLGASPHTNASLRTTIAPTILEAGTKENVLPTLARGIVNFRILPGDTIDSVTAYVKDVVACTIAAAGLDGPAEPGVYNVGSGVATSFNQIVAALRPALGIADADLPTEFFDMPEDIARFYQAYTCADITETKRGLGWSPAYTPEAAIADYGAYLKGR